MIKQTHFTKRLVKCKTLKTNNLQDSLFTLHTLQNSVQNVKCIKKGTLFRVPRWCFEIVIPLRV